VGPLIHSGRRGAEKREERGEEKGGGGGIREGGVMKKIGEGLG